GFSGNLVAGIWLGNDDGAVTKRVTGGNLPVEVWHDFMRIALKDKQPVPLPGQDYFRAPADVPVADAGQIPQYAQAQSNDGSWIPPAPAQRRPSEKNFLERLFGL